MNFNAAFESFLAKHGTKKIFAVCLSVFFLFYHDSQAQQEQWDPDLGDYVEAVFDPGSGELTEEVYESLMQFYSRPLNLNSATREELRMLLLLDDRDISCILDHRREYGSIMSFQELYLVNGIDSLRISAIKDLVTVEPVYSIPGDTLPFFSRMKRFGRSNLILRTGRIIEMKQGYLNRGDRIARNDGKYYVGSPFQVYFRFNFTVPDDFMIGITAEKDAGEKIFIAPEVNGYGFDHYSGFIRKYFRSPLRRITFGDYQVQSGQGLVMGNGLFVGKGTEPIRTTVRHDQGSRTYQGSTEYGYFRGMALDFGGKHWSSTAFFSRKGQDATTDTSSGEDLPLTVLPGEMTEAEWPPETSGNGGSAVADTSLGSLQSAGNNLQQDENTVIRSLLKTGYHRTISELSKKNAASMLSAGFASAYHSGFNHLTVGVSGIWNRLNLPVQEKPAYHNFFDFSGRQQINVGINYNYYRGKFNVFGEVAAAGRGGIAAVQGIIANIGSAFETVIHLRYFSKRYFSFTGRTFGEYAVNNNEQGIYWGVKVFPLPGVVIHFYFDLFRSDWMRFNTAAPGNGNEWMFQFNYVVGYDWHVELYFQEENKPGNLSAGHGAEYNVSSGRRNRARIGFRYEPPEGLSLRFRIQGTSYSNEEETVKGFALVQDAGFKYSRGYVKGRIAYFNTGGYPARQYVYEPDVLYSYTSSMYYGKGFRYMFLFKYSPFRHIDCWLKIGQYIYPGKDKTGSGLEEIDGNKKSEIRCQIRIKF